MRRQVILKKHSASLPVLMMKQRICAGQIEPECVNDAIYSRYYITITGMCDPTFAGMNIYSNLY